MSRGSDGSWVDAETWINGGRVPQVKMLDVSVEALTTTSYDDREALEIRLILTGTGASFSAVMPITISADELDDFLVMVKRAHGVVEETLRRLDAAGSQES